MAIRYSVCFILLLLHFTVLGQMLQLSDIMKGDDFIGHSPTQLTWSADGSKLYFYWNPEKLVGSVPYEYDLKSKKIAKVVDEDLPKIRPATRYYSPDRSVAAFIEKGGLHLVDPKTNRNKLIYRDRQQMSIIHWSVDSKLLFLSVGDHIYQYNRLDGQLLQLAQLSKANKSKNEESKTKPESQYLQDEENKLLEVFGIRESRREHRTKLNEKISPKLEIPSISYDGDLRFALPDREGKFLFYATEKQEPRINTEVPNYVDKSAFTKMLTAREKVGYYKTSHQFFIHDLVKDTSYSLAGVETLPGIMNKPAYMASYHESDSVTYSPTYEKPKPIQVHAPIFSDRGTIAVEARSLDFKDRWILLVDPVSGKLNCIFHHHDEAWIGGPEIGGWPGSRAKMFWLPKSETLVFKSEHEGYAHLYQYQAGQITALTRGAYEVIETELSADGQALYLTTTERGPHERHYYRFDLKTRKTEALTEGRGAYESVLSPDERWIAHRFSSGNTPWELYLQENKKGAIPQRITKSTTEAFDAYPWQHPEIVWFQASDGVKVPARIYRPDRKDSTQKAPAVLFVHGAGYLQNVHHWWSSYHREYMFHHYLRERGYVVMDIDFRASSGYGRDWRTAIYRHMGGRDLQDYVDGAKYLVEAEGVDPARMGIYGGSYGGFITLMAMFTQPNVFKAGAALRSVGDWAHYNHGYTAAILNTPLQDPKAYQQSSPIYFTQGLIGRLLILHGMVDTNVQFQDMVRISQRLIEQGKTGWDLAVYPVEDHGFIEDSSWTDEYRRIFELFESTLK